MRQIQGTLVAASFAVMFACGNTSASENSTVASAPVVQQQASEPPQKPGLGDGLYATIKTARGSIVCQLEYAATPMTVANFVALAEGKHPYVTTVDKTKPFYNGILFHRVVPNFVIQAGDPTGTGAGGPGYTFPEEIVPSLKHDKAGTLAMARRPERGTNASQFYITHTATPALDGNYTVFGHVVSGQDVVNAIQQGDKIESVTIEARGKEAKAFDAVKVLTTNKDKFKAN
ncbi:MAG: peptidylprolyl isomerase [Flavobacteriales bacterium]